MLEQDGWVGRGWEGQKGSRRGAAGESSSEKSVVR